MKELKRDLPLILACLVSAALTIWVLNGNPIPTEVCNMNRGDICE